MVDDENAEIGVPPYAQDRVLPDYWSEACIKLAETDSLMADLINQEKFNKTLSFFIGIVSIIFIYSVVNKNKIIVIENNA